ncbi:MAG: HU family DNA-binding protein [Parcubacteria group bacterium]|nr:HU family DNA-binding protein [Parcubacteria group bacterium]
MNKAQFCEMLYQKAGLESKSAAARVFDSMVEIIKSTLKKGDEVAISGFGTFKVKARAARMGRNPKTGESIQIPAKKAVKFRVGKDLKSVLS